MLITDRKIHFALVGCDRISTNHFGAIEKHADRVELVDVCDEKAAALEQAAARTKAKGHSSLTEMLKTTTTDLVILFNHSGLHPDQAIQVSQSVRHVMTESPWLAGVLMVVACDDANVRLFVVKQNRHNATLQLRKSTIEQGRFSKIHSVAVNVFWSRPQEYYDSANGAVLGNLTAAL